MESPDCGDQRSDGDPVKSESAASQLGDSEPACNGHVGEEESRKATKRKASSSDVEEGAGGKRSGGNKAEDHGRGGEIPAHHARRPPNGFLLFCKRHRDIVSAKNPNLENRGVTKLLGNWWRTLEEDERDKYKELARQNKEIFIANNPQFTWYKLPAPPLRTLVTRPSNRRPPKLEPGLISNAGPITPGKLADESQLGGLTSLLSSSLSPPTTPLTTSPPLPASITAPAHPKKRFLLQTRAKHFTDETHSASESDEATDQTAKKKFKTTKKKYKKRKSGSGGNGGGGSSSIDSTSLKYKRNLKIKWSESISGKMYLENERDGQDPWKCENGCTQQQLIEKIVDSTFDGQKPFQEFDVRRTLDYINTEHTYQKNPSRFWQQQQQKGEKREDCLALQVMAKGDPGADRSIISPNLNNNTIVFSEAKKKGGKNGLGYSFSDNNNSILDYVDPNQRKLDQSSIQTNHDRIRTSKLEDGYIPGGETGKSAEEAREDCDNSKRLEDQKKPLKLAQVEDGGEDGGREEDEEEEEEEEEEEDVEEEDEEEELDGGADGGEMSKNCDKDSRADFQSILGKVSREIVSMMRERGPREAEEMAVARFNVRSRSETDSEGSWSDKSDASPPESPGGRRPKRSCKGRRYEQFIKDSVSKKRSKNPKLFAGIGGKRRIESRSKKGKSEKAESGEESDQRDSSSCVEKVSEFLTKEKEFAEKAGIAENPRPKTREATPEDVVVRHKGAKASEIIRLKLDLELKLKRKSPGEVKSGRRNREGKAGSAKKKPVSKVQMIKEKSELHVGEFNLNEKIEELPLLSFESFLQKKRQRKKRLLGLKKEGIKCKVMKNRLERLRGRSPNSGDSAPLVPNKPAVPGSGQSISKPDFADLTTLAETALTLLSLREPR